MLCGLCLLDCASTHTPTALYALSTLQRQKVLAVFLPGRGGTRFDLQNYGLLDSLRAARLPVDVIGVHAPFRYYLDRSLHTRVRYDVMQPAADSGYRRIWMIGNSMGGLGTLLYSWKHPNEPIEAIVLLGPFLGDEPIVNEISTAGGLSRWSPVDTAADNYQRDVWLYLQACLRDTTGSLPRIYLLAGRDDRLHAGQQLLADALAPDRVFWAPGGHDWDAWRIAFAAFVKYAGERKLFD